MKELEDKIREALPHLKELGKGCVVFDTNEGFEYTIIENNYCPQLYSYDYSSFRTLEFDELKDFKIIGRHIMLNDVLNWLNLHIHWNEKAINTVNTFNAQERGRARAYILRDWNLNSPYLSEQSEELIKLLSEL